MRCAFEAWDSGHPDSPFPAREFGSPPGRRSLPGRCAGSGCSNAAIFSSHSLQFSTLPVHVSARFPDRRESRDSSSGAVFHRKNLRFGSTIASTAIRVFRIRSVHGQWIVDLPGPRTRYGVDEQILHLHEIGYNRTSGETFSSARRR